MNSNVIFNDLNVVFAELYIIVAGSIKLPMVDKPKVPNFNPRQMGKATHLGEKTQNQTTA